VDEREELLGESEHIGGALCLDFTNTVDWHASDHPGERLKSYEDLAWWAFYSHALAADERDRLISLAAQQPERAGRILEEAHVFRESLYRLFLARIADAAPSAADLDLLTRELRRAVKHGAIIFEGDQFTWAWHMGDGKDRAGTLDDLAAPLWPVVRSTVELIFSANVRRLRQCAGDECGWLFLDMSKNQTRRWCSMASCGSRAKALDYYYRSQARKKNRTTEPTQTTR